MLRGMTMVFVTIGKTDLSDMGAILGLRDGFVNCFEHGQREFTESKKEFIHEIRA